MYPKNIHGEKKSKTKFCKKKKKNREKCLCIKEEVVGWISLGQMRKRCRPAIGGAWYTSVLDYFFFRIF